MYTNLLSFLNANPISTGSWCPSFQVGMRDGTQAPCLPPRQSQALLESCSCAPAAAPISRLSALGPQSSSHTESDTCGQSKRKTSREALGFFSSKWCSPGFAGPTPWWSPAWIFQLPKTPDASNRLKEALFSCQGNMALCTVIVIQSFLSGAANATVQNCVWKPLLSFIVSRLKSFLTTSAENKQLSGYWRVD